MDRLLLQTFPDAEAVSHAAAWLFVQQANEVIAARGRFTVALSGGSTPKRLFEFLAGAHKESIDWSRVEIFWGDERALPPDHADSNYRMANEALLQQVPIPAERVHRMPADRDDQDAAARDYQEEIARVFGVSPDGPPPAFDLILLGMGPDGHTASLFPGSPALKETKRWVAPNISTTKPPPRRMTLTRPIINRAHEVLFLVTGADKAAPLFEVFIGPPDPERLPSQLIRPAAGQLVWYLDRAAAAKLTAGIDGAEGAFA